MSKLILMVNAECDVVIAIADSDYQVADGQVVTAAPDDPRIRVVTLAPADASRFALGMLEAAAGLAELAAAQRATTGVPPTGGS